MVTSVVVVESPAKAKTINKYLGNDFTVLASFGHVRDLPSKDGSVRPDDDFAMTYEVDEDSKRHVSAIAKAVKQADHLFLATDPDREGEAISWHVLEALKESRALPKNITVKRVVFNEITKKAVLHGIANPRDIDTNLVNAQQARRALDYLVGFNLSPVLWRKLPGSRSAGRVQSVALRLICERDAEIETFISEEYWDIKVKLQHPETPVTARLTHWEGNKLEKFSITQGEDAHRITAALKSQQFTVKLVEPKQSRRHPYAPFTTSTLQQESARKLGFGAKKTMQLAQKLYEGVTLGNETVGLITYMRTDGVTVSQEAITAARQVIQQQFGASYVPSAPRAYKVKTINSQEAHEAIRPTDVTRTPDQLKSTLDADMYRLYELIWKRMMASQMESAVLDQVAIDLESTDRKAMLRASGSVIKFDGFLKLYHEDKDDEDGEDDTTARLPQLKQGEVLPPKDILPEQHFTEPPPRYSEASLVKKLEELGIGRPSTYAAIISVLQDRGYVTLEKKRFIATTLGRLVSAFLVSFFERYVQYDFTAKLETELDEVSEGQYDWKKLLRQFWQDFSQKIDDSKTLTISGVLDRLDQLLEPFLFPKSSAEADPRQCPSCGKGRLSLKTGKFGAFLGCSSYPECNYTRQLSTGGNAGSPEQDSAAAHAANGRELGPDPATGEMITLKKGPYGFYVQVGEASKAAPKPKRASLQKGMAPEALTLEQAINLLALPREVGTHPETRQMIIAGVGRFGPYLNHDGKYTSLPAGEDVLTIGINRAVDILAEAAAKGGKPGGMGMLRSLGKHTTLGDAIEIWKGRYGPYLKCGKVNAPIPRGTELETLMLEDAQALVDARAKSGASSGGGKKFGKKSSPAKSATKAENSAAKTPKAKASSAKAKPASLAKTASKPKAASKASAAKTAARPAAAKAKKAAR